MPDVIDMPGHLARRFQQIAVAVFLSTMESAGHDLTPVQYATLATVGAHPGIDQATLAGMIANDRATICGVVDRLAKKKLLESREGSRDKRSHELKLTRKGRRTLDQVKPAVEAAQMNLIRGLSESETAEFLRLLKKTIAAANDLSRAPLQTEASAERPDLTS